MRRRAMIDLSCFNYYSPEGETIETKDFQTYSSQYFVRNVDGSVTFIAPSYGPGVTHSAHSTFPRSETRVTGVDGSTKANDWAIPSAAVHVFYQDFAVNELPKSKKVIVGQIHGKGDHPILKRQITGDKICLQMRRKLDGVEDKVVIVDNYKLGTRIQLIGWLFADGRYKEFSNTGSGWSQVVNETLLADGYQYDVKSYEDDRLYGKWGAYSQQDISDDVANGCGIATYWGFGLTHLSAVPSLQPGQLPPPAPPLSADAQLKLDIDAVMLRFKAIHEPTSADRTAAAVELNALSKKVATVTDSKLRAPLYAAITDYKAQL